MRVVAAVHALRLSGRLRRSERFEYRVLDDNRAHAPQVELSALMLGFVLDHLSGHGTELGRP